MLFGFVRAGKLNRRAVFHSKLAIATPEGRSHEIISRTEQKLGLDLNWMCAACSFFGEFAPSARVRMSSRLGVGGLTGGFGCAGLEEVGQRADGQTFVGGARFGAMNVFDEKQRTPFDFVVNAPDVFA